MLTTKVFEWSLVISFAKSSVNAGLLFLFIMAPYCLTFASLIATEPRLSFKNFLLKTKVSLPIRLFLNPFTVYVLVFWFSFERPWVELYPAWTRLVSSLELALPILDDIELVVSLKKGQITILND